MLSYPPYRSASPTGVHIALVCALLLDGLSMATLGDGRPWLALSAHGLASVITAAGMAWQLRKRSREARVRAALTALLFGASMPVLGLLGVWWVVLPSMRASARNDQVRLLSLPLPSFERAASASAHVPESSPGPGLLGSTEERIGVLKALRQMAPERATPLIRRCLTDPSEDVRLLAFAILDQKERGLRQRIEAMEVRMIAETAPALRARIQLRLAELYFELLHGGYVIGEGATSTLAKTAEHAAQALGHQWDGEAATLLAKVSLRAGKLAEAARAMTLAAERGVSDSVLAVLRAELSYLQGRPEGVAKEFASLSEAGLRRPLVEPMASYWTGRR